MPSPLETTLFCAKDFFFLFSSCELFEDAEPLHCWRWSQQLGKMAGTNNGGDCGHEEMAVAAWNGGGSEQGTRPWRGFRAEAATDRGG
jgi:hypothetical protein